MRISCSQVRRHFAVALLVLAAVALAPLPGRAQDETVYGSRQASQAQKEADRLVLLSPEKVIETLSNEPGLLLQVKKRLVKLAFDQGRLLDESDLTDDALFRLIRQDANIRALATREIETRDYIQAKPTREEAARQRREQMYWEQEGVGTTPAPKAQAPGATTGNAPGTQRTKSNQEDDYWRRHEGEDIQVPRQQQRKQIETEPQTEPQQTPQPATRPTDRARELYRAQLDSPYDVKPDMPMEHIRPDDLPDVIAAASERTGGRSGRDGMYDEQSYGRMPSIGRSPAGSRNDQDLDTLGRRSERGRYDRESDLDTRADLRTSMQQPGTMQGLQERPRQPQVRHTPNPYADVPSLYDLYSQVSSRSPKPEQFGMQVFRNGTGNFNMLPMDVPVGPEYVVGTGDSIAIDMWGSVSQRLQRTVDREGKITLPDVGTVSAAGHSLGELTHAVQTALRSEYRDVNADVSLARLRTVRVYVVGEVRNPGAYDISALSTPLNALYAAGGPTPQGSLRHIRHMRGKQVLEEYDAYDLILHGVSGEAKALQPGDSIVVGEIGPQVTVEGMVRRPAIYELGSEKSLAEVLELSGGVMSSGTLRHIEVERIDAHEKRTMLSLDLPATNNQADINAKLAAFKVQDGDHVRIAPIVAYAEKTVYLDGHLFHPGKYAWREGMRVSDVIKSYTDLLPEPYMRHAEIIRLQPPNFAPVVIGFNLGDALAKSDSDLVLQPFDTVRVFSRFDFEDPPIVTVAGEVREPGDHTTNGATRISDAVYLAGGLAPDASTGEAQIYRKTADAKMKVITVDLGKALNGDLSQNLLLQPKDRVIVQRDLAKVDPPTVKIEGEVGKPGKYPLATGMTASKLVELAGGLKRSADKQTADLTRFVQGEQEGANDHEQIQLSKALTGDDNADVALKDGDVLTIRQITGWNDRGATITLRGEVVHPGTYGIREGEKLSSILERAGGLRSDAYAFGAVLAREQVREIEEQNRVEMIRRIERAGDSLRLMPDSPTDPQHALTKSAAIAQWDATLEKLRMTPPSGRLVIHISSDIKRWRNSASDIEVRAGDVLTIPKKPDFVMVTGAVYNPNAVTYRPGRSAEWYLKQGGGPTQTGKKDGIFVIRADGSVVGGGSGLLGSGIFGVTLKPGDTVVVPEKAIGGPSHWQTIFQGAQTFSSVALSAAYLANNVI